MVRGGTERVVAAPTRAKGRDGGGRTNKIAPDTEESGAIGCGVGARAQHRAQTGGGRVVAVLRHGERKRRAGVIMPDLRGVAAMPGGDVAHVQQEIDERGERAAVGVDAGVAKRLAEMAAFGMGLQIQHADDVRRALLAKGKGGAHASLSCVAAAADE